MQASPSSLSRGKSFSTANILLIAGLILAIVSITAAFQTRNRILRRQAAHADFAVNDFQRFIALVPPLLNDQSDYTDDSFPTPPITMLILAPFTKISPANAEFLWGCVKPLFAGAILTFILAIAHRANARIAPLPLLLALAAWFWPLMGDIQEGQMNLLTLLPLIAALYFAQRETPRDDWYAGLLLALAISIKVTPLIFILYFLLRRRFRILLAATAGLALFLIAIPSLALGVTRNLQLLISWSRVMIEPYTLHLTVIYPSSESLPSLIARLFSHVPASVEAVNTPDHRVYMNIANFSPQTISRITATLLLAILSLGIYWLRRPLLTFRCQRYLGEIGIVATFALWASERTWVAHFVTLIFPLIACAMVCTYPHYKPRTKRLAFFALSFAAFTMLLTSDAVKIFGADARIYIALFDLPFWGSLALVITLVTTGLVDRPLENSPAPTPSPIKPLAIANR